MARLLAASNVGPFPMPEDFVIGHQDLTRMSLPKAAPEPIKTIKEIANIRFMLPPLCNNIRHNLDAQFFHYNRNLCLLMRSLGILAWLALASSSAHAELLLRKDGVNLKVTSLVDRVVFCISASGDLKVSSEYGVEFKSTAHNVRFWQDALPKIVTAPPYYFDLPLRIELKTRGSARERRIDVNLGACSAAANACVPITFEVSAPASPQDEHASDCAAPSAKSGTPPTE